MTSTAILIPARWGSKRFPGKMMTQLDGTPMIRRVYDACVSTGIDTYVLTDHTEICELFPNQYYPVEDTPMLPNSGILMSSTAKNGTERCSLAVNQFRAFDRYDQFINVQGDMPDITPEMIHKVVAALNVHDVVTLYADMDRKLREDPNTVKLIPKWGKEGYEARWFGRGFKYGYHHLGVYGYRANSLRAYAGMSRTEYEFIEDLEQLRWFGSPKQTTPVTEIGVRKVIWDGIEINTPEDAAKWHSKLVSKRDKFKTYKLNGR